MDFIETEVDYYAVDVGFSTVIVHDENGDKPDVTFVRKDALDRLAEENEKLRDLVRYMWVADYFSTLPEHQEHQAVVWQRMSELGI